MSAGERRLLQQIGSVLDPLYDDGVGTPPRALRPVVAEAWQHAFHTSLPEPALSRCAAAIAGGLPWHLALWTNDG